MSNDQPERAQGGAYPADYEREGLPTKEGEPPRPPGQRPGAEGSSDSGETWTDPATGAAHEDQPDRNPGAGG